MKNEPATQQIKHYYEQKKLSPSKLQQLMDISQQQDEKETSLNSKDNRWFFKNKLSIAASIFFAFIIGTQMFFYLPTENNEALAERITKEIILNHQKQFNIEFQGDNINELRTHMQKLDFNLIQSSRITELGLKIIGTRYCSIQGEIAAQIKLKDNEGNSYTLYETALKENLEKLTEIEKTVNGLAVTTWSEHGVFFGLVGSKTN